MHDAGLRMRDQGQAFHAEVFLVPVEGLNPELEVLDAAGRELRAIDWKLQDVVLIPALEIPEEAHRSPSPS
ncbi:hypothetical protein [Leucobacter ruminantium]|uniref:Uncharacterized protein n=1 Tax=Leucobacter ruminantium TaxID=1289170 RepID=A0A939LXN6_9MICO|nr:hypothetical protein [Leucobacter ruminantium]MBO1806367.1 hypothetical protein [Leucobacter ruminantium]